VVETAGTPDQTINPEEADDVAFSKSTKSPAFQFYPKEFISSVKVQRMSAAERGVYIMLLLYSWLDGGLSTDHAVLARLGGVKLSQFERMWKSGPLSECFTERRGKLYNDRLEEERRKQVAFRERQAENGKKGGRPITQALAKPLDNQKGWVNPRELNPRVADRNSNVLSSSKREKENDVAFAEFRDAYPKERRKGGHLIEQEFLRATTEAGGHEALMAALVNHKASEQWANPRMIPGMDVWFREERWRQVLPVAMSEAPKPKWTSHLETWKRIEAETEAKKAAKR
jgi:uncharacterized protein YdaU (DUF1376 family)